MSERKTAEDRARMEKLRHAVSSAMDDMGNRWPDDPPMSEWNPLWKEAWAAIDALVAEAEREAADDALERAANMLRDGFWPDAAALVRSLKSDGGKR